MKLRVSLRFYFLVAMLCLGGALVLGFTLLTYHYFMSGIDSSHHGAMVHAVNALEQGEIKQKRTTGFIITDDWESQPVNIRDKFPKKPIKPFKLNKQVSNHSVLIGPNEVYFAMLVKAKTGELKYITSVFYKAPNDEFGGPELDKILTIGSIAIVSAIIFLALLLVILKTIATPVEALGLWTRRLTPERLRQPPPEFRYTELNQLAGVVHQSLNSVQQSLDREHSFLRHASHELRTPIAVIRSNTELLNKLIDHSDPKQVRVIERIERAGLTMSHLTETLLWLSREEDENLPTSSFYLNEELLRYKEEQTYLLKQKLVVVNVETSPTLVQLPNTACRIVLTNLIRNAFQHTQSGQVSITQNGTRVTIVNKDDSEDLNQSMELGFGLGLALTQRLCQRLGWSYENKVDEQGYLVRVDFAQKNQ